MKADDITLQGLLTPVNQYIIPIFQRFYSWDRENWEKLWQDLIELQDPEEPRETHFMGSLVFISEENYPNRVPVYQVIDGQQRLVTMSLLLCALRNVASNHGFSDLALEITNLYLVHQFKQGREHYRIYPRQRDRDQYIAAIKQDGMIIGRIGEALDYFSGQILASLNSSAETGLRSFFDMLQTRLEFVYIKLQGENPYQVFRSLNSTGVDLSEADLIRNFMFMHVNLNEQEEFDDQEWKPLEKRFENDRGELNGIDLSRFFRSFLMMEGRYVRPDATFQSFESRYEHNSFAPSKLAQELIRNVTYYDIIRGKDAHQIKAVSDALAKLRQLESSTTYPLLLNLMNKVEYGLLSIQDFVSALELLSGFILRRYICAESSRTYARWFVSACSALGEQPLAGLRAFLNAKGFPWDDRFKANLLHYPLYGSDYARSILEALEKAQLHKEPADLSQAQIEHIMPQTLNDQWRNDLGAEADRVYSEWLGTIGNLTLSAYNPELQNKPFPFKRQAYSMSNIGLTRQLSDHTTWTEADISTRGQRLADLATRIWIGPGE